MQEWIDRVAPIIREHMEAAQRENQKTYNWPTQPWEFQPSDQVLLLLTNTLCKFLAHWQGPCTVPERVSPVNYSLGQPGKRAGTQLYHINLQKYLLNQLQWSLLLLPCAWIPVSIPWSTKERTSAPSRARSLRSWWTSSPTFCLPLPG